MKMNFGKVVKPRGSLRMKCVPWLVPDRLWRSLLLHHVWNSFSTFALRVPSPQHGHEHEHEHDQDSSSTGPHLHLTPHTPHLKPQEKKNALPSASLLDCASFSSKPSPASNSFQRLAGYMCLFFSYHLLSTTFVNDGSVSLPSRS